MNKLQRTTLFLALFATLILIYFTSKQNFQLRVWNRRLQEENYQKMQTMQIVALEMEELLLSKSELSPKRNSILRNLIGKLRMEWPVAGDSNQLFLADSCSENLEMGYSCPGSYKETPQWPYPKELIANSTFSCQQKLSDVTILLNIPKSLSVNDSISLIQSIVEAYNFVRIVAAVPSNVENDIRKRGKYWIDQARLVPFDESKSESYRWKYIINLVETSMVLIGRDLEYFGHFSDLFRSINLLEKHRNSILAIGGARRLKEGHWINGCSQIKIDAFAFKIQNGYKKSTCDDCMYCNYLRGPFLTHTNRFKAIPLDGQISLPFIKWFYDHRHKSVSLSCPDLLYLTNDKLIDELEGSREDWRDLGNALQFQSVILEKGINSEFKFSCTEVGLKCSPRSSADSFLLPYCCTRSYNYVINRIEWLATVLGIDYELNSGSLLGAVKLNNFIPWDIDGDIYFKTAHISDFFDSGGKGRQAMEKYGFSLTSLAEDNYWDKGAKYFNMHFGGVEFEMQGRRHLSEKECSEFYREKVCKNQTRVLVGNTWARTHANPGKYIRLRYGPGYLRHATSWRYNRHQDNSFEMYKSPGQWNPCREVGHHSCLDSYSGDGNIQWLPSNYPGNE